MNRVNTILSTSLSFLGGSVWFASAAAPAAGQQPVESPIERVTVWGAGAMVERVAALPGAGSFLIRGLPAEADPATVRVRITGGEVVGVEVRERRERALPDARLDALRETVRKLAREKVVLEDERAALIAVNTHLGKLFAPGTSTPETTTAAPGSQEGARPGAEAWAAEREFLTTRFAAEQQLLRTNQWALAAKELELNGAREALRGGEQTTIVLRDVVVDAVAAGSGALQCELSYLVNAAGWVPTYELRAAKELTNVQLTYRARVWQATAEEWSNVDLWLSTAQPQRGAAGPDPRPQWLTLHSNKPLAEAAAAAPEAGLVRKFETADLSIQAALAADEVGALDPLRAAPFAAVSDEGLSVRFHLPDRQTIEPREQGQVVLIGRTELPLAPERTCVPALDPTVWLKGKATNNSDWTLLPGETAVHLGNDYLGKGTIKLTQKGQEFDVHLGPDPFVTVERIALEDQLQTSSFSTNGTQTHTWRLRFENHGAPSLARDGSITVKVQEALPKSRDERIHVRLDSARPDPSSTPDDQKLRDDKSLLTWRLPLARTGKSDIQWTWSANFPEHEQLVTSIE